MGNSSVSVQLLLPICLWTCFLDLFGFMEWGTKPSFFFVETIFAPIPVDIFLWYPVLVLWQPLPFCVTRVVPFPFYLFFFQVETWNHPVLPRVKLYMQYTITHTHIYIIRLHAVVTQQFAMETQHVLTVFYKENHVNNRIKSAMFHSNVKLSEGT